MSDIKVDEFIDPSLLESSSPSSDDSSSAGDSDASSDSGDDYDASSDSDESSEAASPDSGSNENVDWQAVLSTPNVPDTMPGGSSRGPGICFICGETLKEARNIKAHMETAHKERRPKHACLLCLFYFNVRKSFYHVKDARRHIRGKTHFNDKDAAITEEMLMEVSQTWEKEGIPQ